jgi:hypothetical protein
VKSERHQIPRAWVRATRLAEWVKERG